jgi:hypothetical protein
VSWTTRVLVEYLGAGADAPFAAAGTLALTDTASLTTTAFMAAVGTLALNGVAALTTAIQMAAGGELRLDSGGAALRVARNATRLLECGDPLSTACAHWMP